ncbi:MAG TPA: rhomboid family intramembrane serine protease [Solirubrobacterales bacterium]|nr:rhomboid family intramembrane serine protease [Solirubrobacterales bacterium]
MPQTCYRHPNRETAVSCSSCGRPICPECMTPTPVGMRCPECANQRTRVVRNPTGQRTGAAAFQAFPATMVLIAINVIVYLVEIAKGGGGLGELGIETIYNTGALWGPAVHELHQWWRIVTSGFVHVSIMHIGFNMLLLYFMGRLLEPAIGWLRFTVLYFVCLIAGSFVALWFSPDTVSAGASGAIFGVLGATFVIARGRQMEAIAGQIGFLIIFNLIFTFAESGISIGAHVGGLVAGVLCGLLIVASEQGRFGRQTPTNRLAIEVSGMVVLGVLSFILALAVA